MTTPNSPGHDLETADGPLNAGSFAALASLVNAAAQTVPPSSSVTSLTSTLGIKCKALGRIISRASFRFVGAANVSNQTATIVVLLNGVAIPGATSGALATTAGVKSADVDFTSPVTLADGDRLTCTFTPSAALDVVCTDIEVTLG